MPINKGGLIFPDPDAVALPPTADLIVYYPGGEDLARSLKALHFLLEEYGPTKLHEGIFIPETRQNSSIFRISRKYLSHAIRKLKVANFNSEERK